MAVNWAAGLMRWRPHAGPNGIVYPLNHLHPFRFDLMLPAKGRYEAVDVEVRVGFAMHTFTRAMDESDDTGWRYADDREARCFDVNRYGLSKQLPDVVRTLERRKCYHAKTRNFLTLGAPDGLLAGDEYQVFFDLRRLKAKQVKGGKPIIQLIVQSAYATPFGQAPRGRRRQPVGFHVLINCVLAGRKPTPMR